jgi:phosphatidylinositol alpha-mannosyltransferase
VRRYLLTRKLGGVEFLGRVSDDERDALFKTADVYCSPATGRESFGIVLLEAMAAGTAIVCSDIHGYKGVVRRNEDALLVPPGNSKVLAAALARVLSDDELRDAMARSGLARAQEYSWERVTAKVEDYYGFVIRRLASQGQLPPGFHAAIPPSPRVPAAVA